MGRLRVKFSNVLRAKALVIGGAVVCSVGVGIEFGVGFGLMVGGAAAVAHGLLLSDVGEVP